MVIVPLMELHELGWLMLTTMLVLIQTSKLLVELIDIISLVIHSLVSHAQNVTTFSNTATRPSRKCMVTISSKQTPSMSTHGRVVSKNTRNSSIDCARNTPGMVSAFQSKSLYSLP